MKKILKIVSAAAVIFLHSCVWKGGDENALPPRTRAMMAVELVTGGAEPQDYLYSVRYIVFDNASTSPRLDLNQRLAVGPEARESTVFKTTLEVNCNPDKMVILVVNEPSEATAALEAATSPAALEDLMFLMDNAFNDNHTGPADTGLPMTGVKRGISVTEENHSDNPLPVDMTVERSVARIDLYLRTETESTSAWLVYDPVDYYNSTLAILAYTHSTGYLVAGTAADQTRYQSGAGAVNNFGHMLTTHSPDYAVEWVYENPAVTYLDEDPLHIVSFYTPERTCSSLSESLVLSVLGLRTSSEIKSSYTILDSFADENGTQQVLDTIKRNYIYEVTGIVQEDAVAFSHRIIPWIDAENGVIIDPQYYLRMNHDYFYLLNDGERTILTAETNYDRENDDRGFPKGVRVGNISYYNKAGLPVTGGSLYGWLTAQPGGTDDDLKRNILLSVSGTVSAADKGCYATLTITAGNLSRLIRVVRS